MQRLSKIFALFAVCMAAIALQPAAAQGRHGIEKRTVLDGLKARGVHWYGSSFNSSYLNAGATYGTVGAHGIIKWSEVEPTNGGYTFSAFFAMCSTFTARGWYYTFQCNTGSDAPIAGGANWLAASLGVATFTSNGNEPGPYPDYYDAVYQQRLHDLFDTLNRYIKKNFTAAMKARLLGQYVVLSSTGDTGPYKGTACTPSNCLGYADDDTWKTWSRNQILYVQGSINRAGLTHVSCFNEGNNHESLNWLRSNTPFALIKNGEYSHDINFIGETILTQPGYPNMLLRGETQGAILTTPHPHRDGFQMCISALCAGLDYLNIPIGWLSNLTETGESAASPRMTDYFKTYAPHNQVASATKGFIVLADKFSFDDESRFPVGTYGPVVDPATTPTAQYNARVSSINSSNVGSWNKLWLLLDAKRDYPNAARLTAISNYAVSLGAPAYNAAADELAYGNPYGWGQWSNYEFNCRQNNPLTTSLGTWLTGPDSSLFGQYGRKFISTGGGEAMSFDIDNKWNGGAVSGNLQFTITYYNEGTGQFALYARKSGGMTLIGTVTKTNTLKFLQYTVTATNMVLGTSNDFELRYVSGNNTQFNMIEFAKN